MNRILKTALSALLLFVLPALALAEAPVLLAQLPESAQMVENVEFEGGDFIQTAQLFSKEIENSIDNVEALLDAAYAHPAFTDEKLLGMLLNAD